MFMNILMKRTPNTAHDFNLSSHFSDDVIGEKKLSSVFR